MPPQSYSFHTYSPPEFPLISGPEGILNLASEFGYVFLKSYPVFILYISNISGKRDFSMTSITFNLEVPPPGPPTPIVEPPGSPLSLHSPPWTPMSLTKSYCCSEPPSVPLNLQSLLPTSPPSLRPSFLQQGSRAQGGFLPLHSQQLRNVLPPHFPTNSTAPDVLPENAEPTSAPAVGVVPSTWSSWSWGSRRKNPEGKGGEGKGGAAREGMVLTCNSTPCSSLPVSPLCGPPSNPEDQWGFTFAELSDTASVAHWSRRSAWCGLGRAQWHWAICGERGSSGTSHLLGGPRPLMLSWPHWET